MISKLYRSPQIHDLGSVVELTEGSYPGDPDSVYHNHQRRTKKASKKKATKKRKTAKKTKKSSRKKK